MMVKTKVNKSALIRDAKKKNPKFSAADIVALLAKDGVEVSAPLVYNVLNRNPAKRGEKKAPGKKRGRKPKSAGVAVAAASPNGDLFSALQTFVHAAGGLDKAIEILTVLKR